ncbi:NADPH-dependent 7-cyano-7-deazaguanine reductase QueF [Alteromonas sp. a30]|uniref:NADPH-dependent 7-cyano-7-deazaguanine reductase QueF n=1 Tax=Alteromonas sp. a30 TaxID=2730917 RepID=UPI0022804904|nr:NADPH-dependent 7-cyano-7-deazaguanine reductase QueF [Alteromonas sp. a30]MCY7294337.1 NADPH-dependent 7-cyano-7-deazaguanine reductase QueF [Alteromonas sp. a30]
MTNSTISEANELADLTLGKSVTYQENYTPTLLQAVPRAMGRNAISLKSPLPFHGVDIWNGYEFSWLNTKGKPNVAILQCVVPSTSPNLIESKSFKLYLNSFNQTHFDHQQSVLKTLKKDLSECAGESVEVFLEPVHRIAQTHQITEFSGECIDDIDVEISQYQPAPELLRTSVSEHVSETLVSHLLKSNCLITSQPDWASIMIRYQGARIDQANLLKYLISFRQHNEFHEQCVERIFSDIQSRCHPEKLTVYARYTRRGGLDINPIRSNFETHFPNLRLVRQ